MNLKKIIFCALCASVLPTLHAQKPPIDFAAMVTCQSEFETYWGVMLDDFQSDAQIATNGLKRIESDNPFINEYELAEPIQVWGYTTRRLASNSAGLMAILDEPDPHALMDKMGITPEDVWLDGPNKFLANKVLSKTEPEGDPRSIITWQEISLDLSTTLTTHPSKTFAGCSYRLQTAEPEPTPKPKKRR